ncbi:MAG: hypothetical protein H6662_11090 [Ardenticatenaceae bacterium]|nr:hypothetical protein [Ardenticatenaceae bacterium]MCB9003235.1 hypothetical protein [Ardenticatenaceae bacterium]
MNEVQVTEYIQESEIRLSQLVRRQFAFMTVATLLPTIILLLVLTLVPRLANTQGNTSLLNELQSSNQQLSDISQTLLRNSPTVTDTQNALSIILLQANLHKEAIAELDSITKQPSVETQSLIQVIGSAAILALLGALGIQRLQNIDTEINNLRSSMFAQSEARSKAIKENLQSQIGDEVQNRFESAKVELETLSGTADLLRKQFGTDSQQMLDNLSTEIDSVKTDLNNMLEIVSQYPWLKSKEDFDTASQIQYLSSVQQAHDLAVSFRTKKDNLSARHALEVIIENKLPGGHNDFHNAFSEAMRLNENRLGLEIAKLGLQSFPDQYDLIADAARGYQTLGKVNEARDLIEDWRKRKPQEFTRSWRPVVFYEDLFDSLEITQEDSQKLIEAFAEVIEKSPYEIKPWSEYASFIEKSGDIEQAEEILRKGISFNPFSQQLNYVMGELLLKQGRAEESLTFLDQAFRNDYQKQYQHDVNQFAVRATLAQACEATENYDRAQLLYSSIINSSDPDALRTIKTYATNRIEIIELIQGQIPSASHQTQQGQIEELVSQITIAAIAALNGQIDRNELANQTSQLAEKVLEGEVDGSEWQKAGQFFEAVVAILESREPNKVSEEYSSIINTILEANKANDAESDAA